MKQTRSSQQPVGSVSLDDKYCCKSVLLILYFVCVHKYTHVQTVTGLCLLR